METVTEPTPQLCVNHRSADRCPKCILATAQQPRAPALPRAQSLQPLLLMPRPCNPAAQSGSPSQGEVPRQSCVGPRALPGILIHTQTHISPRTTSQSRLLCSSQAVPRSSSLYAIKTLGPGWQISLLCPHGPISLLKPTSSGSTQTSDWLRRPSGSGLGYL